jgi:hypothetical protein
METTEIKWRDALIVDGDGWAGPDERWTKIHGLVPVDEGDGEITNRALCR